ncbi:hypothetical protein NA56DRAFT_705044 [Hyaloscypha hepaticicola]|uniref:Uncharacterized protein n=1 Tax=Hyaloscypha hepaticicola TaxID=2082293 RepID=A0A2J6Q0J6_9HELO|nr:hypothetical protein NA56DRAFT_705044 [Hyaloscypha hepaticicola]
MFLKLPLCALPTENAHIMTLWRKHRVSNLAAPGLVQQLQLSPISGRPAVQELPPVPSIFDTSKIMAKKQTGQRECLVMICQNSRDRLLEGGASRELVKPHYDVVRRRQITTDTDRGGQLELGLPYPEKKEICRFLLNLVNEQLAPLVPLASMCKSQQIPQDPR